MGDIEGDLPTFMTMAAFIGIAWYIGIEINISLLLLFKRRRGLYFWSCALVSWGVVLQPLFIILADFGIWREPVPAIAMIYLTWLIMVVPQSWVLFSRLHLLLPAAKVLKVIKLILIFNSVAFSIPTIVIGTLAQSTTVNARLVSFNLVWDRVQLVVFFVQETSLSLLYIWQTHKYLRDAAPLFEPSWSVQFTPHRNGQQAKSEEQKTVLRQLIYSNILIIALDIALLGIQCAGLFYIQGAFKPCVYGIKLKVEFVILNRLISSIQKRAHAAVYPETGIESHNSTGQPASHSGISHKPGPESSSGNQEVELGMWNDGSAVRWHSRGSEAPILAS
ncbi:hypothetical protein GGR54DRAFT_457922 [Hypoxylon sp. NC1633]|nr:hypothetical protein GGR54DRAFT_457922 [Hypoxylon sp. NC1633]